MKTDILILTTFPIHNTPLLLKNCRTMFDTVLVYLVKYLSMYDNINIIYGVPIPRIRSSTYLNHLKQVVYPIVDHCILVDDKGFHSRLPNFLEKLRETTKCTISSIGISNVYYGGEDMLFYFSGSGLKDRPNTCSLGWVSDYDETVTDTITRNYSSLNILFNDYDTVLPGTLSNEDIKKKVSVGATIVRKLQKFKEKQSYVDVNLKQVRTDGFRNFTTNNAGKWQTFGNSNSDSDRHNILSSANIYIIVNSLNIDKFFISELALMNVSIIAPYGLFDASFVKLYEIETYEGSIIPWHKIKFNGTNNQQKLVNEGCTWKDAVAKIYHMMTSHIITSRECDTRSRSTINCNKKFSLSKTIMECKQYNPQMGINDIRPVQNRGIILPVEKYQKHVPFPKNTDRTLVNNKPRVLLQTSLLHL